MTNLEEYIADTDPLNDTSYLGLLHVGPQLGGWRVDWKGGVNAWQMLDYQPVFNPTGIWNMLIAFPPPTLVTNAVIIFGIDTTNAVFRIRAQR